MAQLLAAVDAAAPDAEIAPVAKFGLVPPTALIPFPVMGAIKGVTIVAFNVVFTVTPGTVTVAVPPAKMVAV